MKLLKKSIFATSIFCTMFLVFSCSNDDNSVETKATYKEKTLLYKSVTSDEYLNATDLEKRFIDQVDAAVNSIDILKKNNPSLEYEAIISINKDPKNKLNNSIIIGLVDNSKDAIESKNARVAAPDGKCHVCGLKSAWVCISEVEENMDKKHTNTISATITRTKDGCVDIAYH
jgi:hypothetical protein